MSDRNCPTCGCPCDPWLTVKEVAAALRVSKQTVRRLLASGDLAATRFGRAWRVKHESLDDYLEAENLGETA
jgi:excisionase family DNA binding protein